MNRFLLLFQGLLYLLVVVLGIAAVSAICMVIWVVVS